MAQKQAGSYNVLKGDPGQKASNDSGTLLPIANFLRQPLRLTLLRAIEEDNQSVDQRRSIRLRRDIGRDQLLSLNVQRHVGVEFGD
jgi:hypothetical protein